MSEANAFQFVLVLLICAIDGADVAVLGAAFKNFEQDLGMTPITLGLMTLAQSLSAALTAPVWGWVCDSGISTRRILWTIGALGWAMMMLALAFSSSMSEIIPIRLANGMFISCLGPLTQSWVAEQVPPEKSGRTFGFLSAATIVGATVSTLLITVWGENSFILGGRLPTMAGWRVVCIGISGASAALAVAIATFMDDEERTLRRMTDITSAPAEIIQNLRDHWRIRTFRIIVFQGVVGSIPWSALSFRVMFFQYLGFSSRDIAFIVSMELCPRIFGGMLGGYIGDYAASISPTHGRAYTGQICLAATIPLMLMQIVFLPSFVGTSVWPYVLASVAFNLMASWTPAGLIRPLFLEVTEPGCRASILAWETALEGVSSAVLGAPLVGFLAEDLFGYAPSSNSVLEMDASLRANNFEALQASLTVMTTLPWLACFVAISMLHWSSDRAADKANKLSVSHDDGYGAIKVVE
eukprot:TRINITY_DN9393_c0_g1_i1.p1 TRINITY_DN9393_c0_g1~~TRINITY_DN9393_c0_g1_i1.p1  ORF type:complete len:468 (+),score=66.12 TRINITY_DN9393_c0_g1_i1:69-1472(+)